MFKASFGALVLDGVAPRAPNVGFSECINLVLKTFFIVFFYFGVLFLVFNVQDLLEVVFEELCEVFSITSLLIHFEELFVD